MFALQYFAFLFDLIPMLFVVVLGLAIAYFVTLCALGGALWATRARELPQPMADADWFDRLRAEQ